MSDLDAMLDESGRQFVARCRQKRSRTPAEPAPKKRGNPERDIQKAIVSFIRKCTDCLVHASVAEAAADASNPDARARYYASRAKAGVHKGWPDLTVVWCGGVLFLEVKAVGGHLSPAQRVCHAELAERGHVVALVRSMDEARAALVAAGAPVRGAVR